MRTIDSFSKTVGSMSTFNEMLSCGAKNLALGVPVYDKTLRDEHMEFAKVICEDCGTQCVNEDEPFITDLFRVSLNKDKYNILFFMDEKYLHAYNDLKARKKALVASGEYKGAARYQIAYDFGKLLSYTDEAIDRMIAACTERE
jgi:hypothetical protein